MTIGSIFLGLALLILVGLFVSRPLLKPDWQTSPKSTPLQALQAQKEAILVQIRNLEFDFETGKLAEADYQVTREEYMVVAEEIFRQLDESGADFTDFAHEQDGSTLLPSLEDDIERAIARRRTKTALIGQPVEGFAPVETKGAAKFCPECGKPNDPDDKFCANCGFKLVKPQHA